MAEKVITTGIKSFVNVGYLLLGAWGLLVLKLYFDTGNFDILQLLPLLIGFFFVYLGKKGRQFVFSETDFKYSKFSARYDEINLLKTFKDTKNNSNNLLIFIDETNILSLSSSFYSQEILEKIYYELVRYCKKYIENNELTLENELNW